MLYLRQPVKEHILILQVWRGALSTAAAAAAEDELGGATLQCTMRDLPAATADALSDALLEMGAASAA